MHRENYRLFCLYFYFCIAFSHSNGAAVHAEAVKGVDSRFSAGKICHSRPIHVMEFSPDGNFLAVGTKGVGNVVPEAFWEGELKIWDLKNMKGVFFKELDQWVKGVSFSSDGKFLAVACSSANYSGRPFFLGFNQRKSKLTIFEFPSMKEVKAIEFESIIHYLEAVPDSTELLVGFSDDFSKPNNSEKQKYELFDWKGPDKKSSYSNVVFSSQSQNMQSAWIDGKFFGYGKDENGKVAVQVFNKGSSEERRPLNFDGFPFRKRRDGSLLVLGSGGVYVYSFPDGKMKETIKFSEGPSGGNPIGPSVISADETRILAYEEHGKFGNLSKVYWENAGERRTVTAYTVPNNRCKIAVAKFSAANAKRFGIGINNFPTGVAEDFYAGCVLLFEERKQ